MTPTFSIYEYLTFVLPGATVLFTAIYGWHGWPWGEPGTTGLVGLVAASFVVGNAVTALGTWLEPMLLSSRPGSFPDGLWGQFGPGDRYAGRQEEFETIVRARYGPETSLSDGYRLAQAELRAVDRAAQLDRLNQQLGFYRGMTTAALVSIAIETAYTARWRSHLPPELWLPLFAVSGWLFAYRFRRFWRWFGDYVLRGLRTLPPRATD